MALRSVALLMMIIHAATAALDYSHLSQDNFKLYAQQFNKTYNTEADANKAFDCWRENSARCALDQLSREPRP